MRRAAGFDYGFLGVLHCVRFGAASQDGLKPAKLIKFCAGAIFGVRMNEENEESVVEKTRKSVVEEFLSSPSEVHAFFLGIWHAFANLIHPQPLKGLPEELRRDLRKEWHYFCFGFLVARVVQVLSLLLIYTYKL